MTKECCTNCKMFCKTIRKLDFACVGPDRKEGEYNTEAEGFACLLFADEGVVTIHVNHEPEDGVCECYMAKE